MTTVILEENDGGLVRATGLNHREKNDENHFYGLKKMNKKKALLRGLSF